MSTETSALLNLERALRGSSKSKTEFIASLEEYLQQIEWLLPKITHMRKWSELRHAYAYTWEILHNYQKERDKLFSFIFSGNRTELFDELLDASAALITLTRTITTEDCNV